MALRIRKDRKTIVCAAEHPKEDGDCYLDDAVHYALSTELNVLRTDDEGGSWYFQALGRVPAEPR